MEIDVTSDIKNPLMGRRDIQLFVSHEGLTPRTKDLESALALKLKVKETQVVVNHIYQGNGRWDAKVLAKVYDKPIKEEKKAEVPKSEESAESVKNDAAENKGE